MDGQKQSWETPSQAMRKSTKQLRKYGCTSNDIHGKLQLSAGVQPTIGKQCNGNEQMSSKKTTTKKTTAKKMESAPAIIAPALDDNGRAVIVAAKHTDNGYACFGHGKDSATTRIPTRRANLIATIRANANGVSLADISRWFGDGRGGVRTVGKYLRKCQLLADGKIVGDIGSKEDPAQDAAWQKRCMANLQWCITENTANPVSLRSTI